MSKNFTYLVVLLILLIACEREVSITPPDQLPPTGKIILKTVPSGFDIFLNNRDRVRKTPDSLSFLKDGSYKITLKKNNFFDSTFIVDVVDEKLIEVRLDYTENPKMLGGLRIESLPIGSSIAINDSATNKTTPYTFENLLPGTYKITLSKENFGESVYYSTISSSEISSSKTVMIDTSIWKDYNLNNSGIASNSLTGVTIDLHNTVWFASRSGVISYNGITWKNILPDNSPLPHKVINSISVDNENNIWACTASGLAKIKNDEVVMRYISSGQKAPLQATGFPTDIFQSNFVSEGFPLLFGTDKGFGLTNSLLFGEHYYTWEFKEFPNISNNVTAICKISNSEEILIGTKGSGIITANLTGLSENLYENNFNRFNSILPTNNVSALFADNIGGVWIGEIADAATATGGLIYYNNSQFKKYELNTSQASINTIFVDSRDIKWIGTKSGVLYFKEFDKLQTLNKDNVGLELSEISGICEDVNGNIWISTKNNGAFFIKDANKLLRY